MAYAAAAAAAAAIAGGIMNAKSQANANEQNAQIAKDQMVFQANMSNTAHQREVADLRKAGLNPILSAGGSGASSPGGAAATMIAPDIGSSAKAAADAYNQISRMDADTKNTIADTQLKASQQALSNASAASTAKDIEIKNIETAYKGATMAKDLEKKGVDIDGGKIANSMARATFQPKVSEAKSSAVSAADKAKYSFMADKYYEAMGLSPTSSAKKYYDESGKQRSPTLTDKFGDFVSDITGVGVRRLGGTK